MLCHLPSACTSTLTGELLGPNGSCPHLPPPPPPTTTTAICRHWFYLLVCLNFDVPLIANTILWSHKFLSAASELLILARSTYRECLYIMHLLSRTLYMVIRADRCVIAVIGQHTCPAPPLAGPPFTHLQHTRAKHTGTLGER